MLLIPGSVRVFVAREPIDMRKSFEGLGNQVQYALGHNPLSGDERTTDLVYYPTAFIAVMQRICKLLGVEIPDVTLEDAAVFVKRRTDELLNPKPTEHPEPTEEPKKPAEKHTPKVAPARKSGSARTAASGKARVPDTADEEEPPRGQGDVDRDESEDDQ